jgi:hypothetical protein
MRASGTPHDVLQPSLIRDVSLIRDMRPAVVRQLPLGWLGGLMNIDEVLRELIAEVVRPIVRDEMRAVQPTPSSRPDTEFEPLWTATDVARYLKTSRSWA